MEHAYQAETQMAGALLDALLDEIKLLQEPYPKLSASARHELTDRLSRRIESEIKKAMRVLVQQEYPAVPAELGNVVFTAKGIKANVLVARNSESRHELADHAVQGASVLVILADPEEYLEGLDAQRDLPLGLTDGVDTATGEVLDPAKPEASTNLVDRLEALGTPVARDNPFWQEATPGQLAEVMDYVKAREAGEDAAWPESLASYRNQTERQVDEALKALAWLDDADITVRELVEALTANGVPVEALTEETVTGWTEDQTADLWDWVEVSEHDGPATDKPQETIDANERAAKLLADADMLADRRVDGAQWPGSSNPPDGQWKYTPEGMRAELAGIDVAVPLEVIVGWTPEEISAVHAYIDESSGASGPAIVPECLVDHVVSSITMLASQGGATQPDEWDGLAKEPKKLGERLVAHKIPVPAHVVYGWSDAERLDVAHFMRSVIRCAEAGRECDETVPTTLAPYVAPGPAGIGGESKSSNGSAETASDGGDLMPLSDVARMSMGELRDFAAGHGIKARGKKGLIKKLQAAGLVGQSPA